MTITDPRVDADEILDGYSIIDCDAHFTEPPNLWTSRVPAGMTSRVPVMKTLDDGVTAWYLDDQVIASSAENTIRPGAQKVLGTQMIQPWSQVDESTYNPSARVARLDQMGIYAQILFPNAMGFASNTI